MPTDSWQDRPKYNLGCTGRQTKGKTDRKTENTKMGQDREALTGYTDRLRTGNDINVCVDTRQSTLSAVNSQTSLGRSAAPDTDRQTDIALGSVMVNYYARCTIIYTSVVTSFKILSWVYWCCKLCSLYSISVMSYKEVCSTVYWFDDMSGLTGVLWAWLCVLGCVSDQLYGYGHVYW